MLEELLKQPLSELIEACGDRFVSVKKMRDGNQVFWVAYGEDKEHGWDVLTTLSQKSKNIKEAVANLYLLLNGRQSS